MYRLVSSNQIAKAKVNLCLHVTGQREDGYHLLDSLVVFADYGDELSFVTNNNLRLTIGGPFGDELNNGKNNLIYKAAQMLDLELGVDIDLIKNLPISSGIGGGSADAAATLRGLAKHWNLDLPSDKGLALGADVPVCLSSISQRMQGIGDVLAPIGFLPKLAAILINTGDGVSTPDSFHSLNNKNNESIGELPTKKMDFMDTIQYLRGLRNDLQEPVCKLLPSVQIVINSLDRYGSSLSRMSGSGGTCFGLFKDFQEACKVVKELQEKNPSWWIKPVILG